MSADMACSQGSPHGDVPPQDTQTGDAQNAVAEIRQEAPFPIPDGYHLVNDFQGVLTLTQVNSLSEKLYRLEKKNGTQIVLLIVPTVGDMPIHEYASKVMEKWNPGNHGDGNGLLFLISARPANFWLATGAGISGALPDIKLRHIWLDHLDPHFKRQEWFEGIDESIDALIAAASGEETPGGTSHAQLIVFTRGQLIAAGLALIGVLYATFLMFKRYRNKNSKLGG